MARKYKVILLLVCSVLFFFMVFSLAFGGMKVHLKNGTTIDVPAAKDDIVSIEFDDHARPAPGGGLLETLIVPNDKPVKITSSNVLERGQWYTIEASGVISDWSNVRDGVDAVWCYAEWRCGKNGEIWNQLRINDKGMTDIAGRAIPYNPDHVYKVRYQGEGKRIELYCIDAQGSWSDNSGWLTVKIYRH